MAGGLVAALVFASACVLLGLLLLGLPGALIYEGAVHLLLGHGADDLASDAAWPLAIVMSLLWPLGVPGGWLVSRMVGRRWIGAPLFLRASVLLGVACAWVLALSLVLHQAGKAA